MKVFNFGLCVVILLVCGLASGQVQARTLEEILRDKGVITAEDFAEAAKSGQVFYTPGRGLTATSADGSSRMKIGGYAQLLYRYTNFDAPGTDAKSDFDIRRFKLQVQGHLFNNNFGYKLQGDVSSSWRTEDVFIKYTFAPILTLQAGQFKPAQARQELTSAARQLFPERSLANDTFNLGRDQGLQAAGSFDGKLVAYRIGIYNGNGPNIGNVDDRYMFCGRVDLNPLNAYKMDEAGWAIDKPLLNIGGSFAREEVTGADVGNKFGTDNDVMDKALDLDAMDAAAFSATYGNDLTWLLWTANLNATWMGASIGVETYHLIADPAIGDDWDADGYYVQAGYMVIPDRLELGVRYSKIESADVNASENFDKAETQYGVNYYFVKHKLKLQSDITLSDDKLSATDDMIFRLQAQFSY